MARSLRGEIDSEIARQAREDIRALLPRAEALYEEHAVVASGLSAIQELENVTPFWTAMGLDSFDAWLTTHPAAIGMGRKKGTNEDQKHSMAAEPQRD